MYAQFNIFYSFLIPVVNFLLKLISTLIILNDFVSVSVAGGNQYDVLF